MFQKCFLKRKLYGPFLRMGFNTLKATEPRNRDSIPATTKSLGVPGTHFDNVKRMKDRVDLGATQWF